MKDLAVVARNAILFACLMLSGFICVIALHPFFFSWMLHDPTSSLSGRSPFCQLRKDKRCRCNIGYEIPIESNGVKTQKDTNQTTLQPSRECKGVESRWPVPQTIN